MSTQMCRPALCRYCLLARCVVPPPTCVCALWVSEGDVELATCSSDERQEVGTETAAGGRRRHSTHRWALRRHQWRSSVTGVTGSHCVSDVFQ